MSFTFIYLAATWQAVFSETCVVVLNKWNCKKNITMKIITGGGYASNLRLIFEFNFLSTFEAIFFKNFSLAYHFSYILSFLTLFFTILKTNFPIFWEKLWLKIFLPPSTKKWWDAPEYNKKLHNGSQESIG